jgi:hypothetical protein
MALQFDGEGYVTIPALALSGEFSISGTCTYTEAGEAILGGSANAQDGILLTASGLQLSINNVTRDITLTGIAPGDTINYSLSRAANNQITFTANGETASSVYNSSVFDVDRLGTYHTNVPAIRYSGEMSGTLVFNDAGVERSYNFDTSNGTELTDTTSSQHGTLTDFSTGGFTGGGTSNNPPVVDAGSEINATGGQAVQLAATVTDADGDTLTYTWSQTGGTAGSFSATNIENPTFTPANVTETVTLQLSVFDGTDTQTDTVTLNVTANETEQTGTTSLLQFDTQKSIIIPTFTAADDIEFRTKQKFRTGRVWIGKSSTRQDYIMCSSGSAATPFIRVNIGGINKDFEFDKLRDDDYVEVVMKRAVGDNTLYILATFAGVTKCETVTSGATITFDAIGEYNNPYAGIRYDSTMTGLIEMSRVGDARRYNFGAITGTTLPEEIGGNDVDLTEFVGGDVVYDKEIQLALPAHRRKRDENGDAVFTVSGEILNASNSETLEYSLDGTTWQALETTTDGSFSSSVTVNESKDLTVRLSSDTSVVARTYDLKAVLIIYAWGQSNDAGQAENNQPLTVTGSNPVPEMIRTLEDGVGGDTGVLLSGTYALQEVRDPTPAYRIFDTAGGTGSTWPAIVSQYANRGIPVVLYNIAVGGTGIEQWLRASTTDPAYYQEPNELPEIVRNMGNPHFITAYRGEYEIARIGEATPAEERYSQQDVEDLYNLATDQHFTDYGCPTFWTLPTSLATSNYAVYKAGMDNVIASNSNAYSGGIIQDVVTLQGAPTDDGIHLTTDEQVTTAAQARYAAFEAEEYAIGLSSSQSNIAPIANAGADQSVEAGETFTLDGSASTDGDGTIVEYRWTQTAGDTVTLDTSDPIRPTGTAPVKTTAQTLTFSLVTVDDDGETSAPASVDVYVAAFNINNLLNTLDTRRWELTHDGSVQAFQGRSNREAFKFKIFPSEDIPEFVDDDGYFVFDSPGINKVEVITAAGSSVSSSDDVNMIRGNVVAARTGDLTGNDPNNLELTFVLYVDGDDDGLVMTASELVPYQKAAYFRR